MSLNDYTLNDAMVDGGRARRRASGSIIDIEQVVAKRATASGALVDIEQSVKAKASGKLIEIIQVVESA